MMGAGLAGQSNDEKPASTASKVESELLKDIMDNIKKGREHRSKWREQAKEDFDFYAGKQWSDVDARILRDSKRSPVVFNRIVRAVNAVIGLEVQNRQEVTYIPRKVNQEVGQQQPNQMPNPMMQGQAQPPFQMGQIPQQAMMPPVNDTGYADMLNDAAKWVRDEGNFEDEESEGFEHTVICGEGWTETRMDYGDDVEGMIVKDILDPIRVLVDPESKKRNYEDARWVSVVKDFEVKQVREMWPDIVNPAYGSFWDDADEMDTINADENYKYLNDKSDHLTKPEMVAVVQYQYYKKEPIYLVADPESNELVQMPSSRFSKIRDQLDFNGIKYTKVQKKVYYQCMVVGGRIAEKTPLGCEHFTLRAITGMKDKNNNSYFGLVTMMKDPQRWANKWLSQIQHILNSNSKGGVMYEESAVDNIQKFESEWAKPDGVMSVRDGAISGSKIQAKPVTPYPDGIDRLLQYAINAINDVVGVNLEMMGQANRDQPIGLEQVRKEAGITILAKLFDSLRRYRKMDGKILAYFIREYIADGRLIRILGDQGIQYVPLIKDKVAFKYDIIVDEAPTSPHAKERTFMQFQAIFPSLQAAGIPIPKSILDYSPFPDKLVQEWKKEIEEAAQPDPLAQKMQELQVVQAQLLAMQQEADIQKTHSEVERNAAASAKDMATAADTQALANERNNGQTNGHLLNAIESAANHELKATEMMKEQDRKDLELLLNQRRKNLELQIDTMLKERGKVRVPSPNMIQ